MNCDIIVIGSGIAGMTCGSALANKDYKVMVFESHCKIGGYCQSFKRNGFRFSSSVHRIGGILSKNNITNLLKELNVKEEIGWYRFKEHVKVGDFEFDMCNVNLADKLKEIYPEESENLDKLVDEVNEINNALTALDVGTNKGFEKFSIRTLKVLKKYKGMTVEEFLETYLRNPTLRSIFMAVTDAIPGASVMPFVRLLAFANYSDYTYQPIGGAESILNAMRDVIIANHGEVHLNSPVTKILIENGRAVGVESQGIKYYSKYIIANADIITVLRDMIGYEHVGKELVKKVQEEWEVSPSCFAVWLGLDDVAENIGLTGENITYYPNAEKAIENKRRLLSPGSYLEEDDFLLISTSANLDPTSTPKGKSQVMLGMLVASDFENNCGVGRDGKRGVEYQQRKKEIAMRLIKQAEKVIPGISKHIEVMEIATPKTYERYTHNTNGAYGGFKATPKLIKDYAKVDSMQIVPRLFVASNWGGVGDGIQFLTDLSMRLVDRLLTVDKREDVYDFNKKYDVVQDGGEI